MKRLLLLSMVGLVGCSDDGRNKTTPDTALVEVPAELSNQAHVRILFEARGNANGFLCTLDGQTSPCISPFEADVADGEHTFEVAAALNMNVDETPATHTWRVDTVPPDTTITTAPPALDNSSAPELAFSGSEPNVTFECAVDGAAFTACTSPFTANVVDGAHTFAVRAKDQAGNVDPSPAMHAWTVDTTAPDTQITNGPAAGATTGPSGAFEFSSNDTTATFECKLDAGAFAACTSPFAFTLGDGMHTFTVRAKDPLGTVDPSPPARTWTVDAVAPPVTITATPTNPSNVTAPQFSFTSTDPTATFECQIDGVVAFTACTSTWTGPTVTDGNRTFRVRATDPVGNVGTPATFAWVVDTVPPTLAFTAVPAALSNDNTPTVAFTAGGGAVTTECRVDAGNFATCTSPFTAAALADGAHTISVRATDAAGNAATITTSAFTIDTVPPTVMFTSQPAALSNDTTPTVQFTTAGGATTIECRVDSGAFSPCTSGFTPTVGEGTHTIGVRVTDAAGNSAIFTTTAFVVDTTPPTVSITGQPPAMSNNKNPQVTFTHNGMSPTCRLDGGAAVACTSPHTFTNVPDGSHTITVSAVDGAGNTGSATTSTFSIDTVAPTLAFTAVPAALSNDNTPTVAFTAGGATTTECRVDAGNFAACTSPFTAAALTDGSHTISVRATDAAGNATTITTSAFTIDTVPPTVTFTSQPAALSNNTTPTVQFTTAGGATTIECRVDTGAFSPCTSGFTPTVGEGTHTIGVRVADAAGNSAIFTTNAFVVDTTPPTLAFTTVPAALSNNTTPTVAFTTGGGAVATECRVDAGNFAACTSPFTSAALADGAHTISVRATDAAGNAATITTSAFTIDTVPPSVTFTSQPAALSNDTTPTVQFTTAGGATTIECRVNSGAFSPCTSGFTPTVGEGTHTIGVRVTDAAGNSAIFTTNAFVVDTTPPTVTITAQPPALSNNKNPQVTFTHNGMSPTCRLDGGTAVACTSPHTFTNVLDGSHTITVTAVDGAGNVGSATTSSFSIDTVAPVLAFTEQPPAAWPVNYFDFSFTVGDSATVQCSVDGAAFTACGSSFPTTVAYNTAHTLQVRGTDSAGNQTTITSAAWTPVPGMVLHYPWEQGSTQNTSLLRQRPAYSPDGGVTARFVGGWAGSALGSNIAAHTYPKTVRPLTSSPTGTYMVSFWMRATSESNGTIFSTVGTTGGVRATLAAGQLTWQAFEGGQSQSLSVPMDNFRGRWVHVAARVAGNGLPLEIFMNGANFGKLASFNGFNTGQASALTVGSWSSLDVDDLRFYNVAFSNDEICTLLARGFKNANGACVPLAPGFEIDFEGRVADTGVWRLPLVAPQAGSFKLTPHTLGEMFNLLSVQSWGYAIGGASFQANVSASPGRSFSFEFVPNSGFGAIVDWRIACLPTGGGGQCGMSINHADNNLLQIFTGTPTDQKFTNVTTGIVPDKFNNVVVTEQRAANGTTTSLTVYINGKRTVIPISGGDLYARVNDNVTFNRVPNLVLDEIEFWPADLSTSAEMLCENGFDGEFDVATGGCLFTYGP